MGRAKIEKRGWRNTITFTQLCMYEDILTAILMEAFALLFHYFCLIHLTPRQYFALLSLALRVRHTDSPAT